MFGSPFLLLLNVQTTSSVAILAQVGGMVESMSSENVVQAALQRWRKPSRKHSAAELNDIMQLVESGKQFTKDKQVTSIEVANDRPILISYVGDGTPIKTMVACTTSLGDLTKQLAAYL